VAQFTRVEREDYVRCGHRCDQRLNSPLRQSVYKRSQQIIRRNEPRSIGARIGKPPYLALLEAALDRRDQHGGPDDANQAE
jgi:hypothetical protein